MQAVGNGELLHHASCSEQAGDGIYLITEVLGTEKTSSLRLWVPDDMRFRRSQDPL